MQIKCTLSSSENLIKEIKKSLDIQSKNFIDVLIEKNLISVTDASKLKNIIQRRH